MLQYCSMSEMVLKSLNKKSAKEVVAAAVMLNKVVFGVEISYQTKKRWVRLISNYPELTASMFRYRGLHKKP